MQTCNNPKKVVSPNVNNPKKVVSPNVNNPKKIVSPNVKIETEKPVTKPQQIDQKVKKDKSAASAPTDGSMRKRTTHDDVMEDSDPEFNCEWLPTPGLESDNWFYRLGKEVQISFEKGKEKFIFVCRKCKRSCTRRADVRCHWRLTCPENPNKAIQCKYCDSKKMVYGESGFIFHCINFHEMNGEVVCLKCQVLFQNDTLLNGHVCHGVQA